MYVCSMCVYVIYVCRDMNSDLISFEVYGTVNFHPRECETSESKFDI
jgi:hypothetical protein